MPKASGDSTTTGEFELEQMERQGADALRAWAARMLGEIEEPGSVAKTAERAAQIGAILSGLTHAMQGIRLAREVYREHGAGR